MKQNGTALCNNLLLSPLIKPSIFPHLHIQYSIKRKLEKTESSDKEANTVLVILKKQTFSFSIANFESLGTLLTWSNKMLLKIIKIIKTYIIQNLLNYFHGVSSLSVQKWFLHLMEIQLWYWLKSGFRFVIIFCFPSYLWGAILACLLMGHPG